MEEGIRIEDIAFEISPTGLVSLLDKKGLELKVNRLDLSISEAALNSLLERYAPADTAPAASVEGGQLTLTNSREGATSKIELGSPGLRLEVTGSGLRLRTETES